jgi:hypothetical protein
MPTDSGWFLLLLVMALLWWAWLWRCQPTAPQCVTIPTRIQWLLRPRTPDDCPACCQPMPAAARTTPTRAPVTPWRERKSRRGAPKRIDTQGFACPNRGCPYYRITAAQLHALVGDGAHGRCERRETLRCQACTTTFSTRRDTPLYSLKTSSQRVGEVLTALAEGLSIAAAVRVFGHRHATITTWLRRAGEHSVLLHDRWFRNLYLPHLQLDELRTRLRCRAHVLWLWVVVDPISKLIPVLHLGARTQDVAHMVAHDLYGRLARGCLPVFTSDGLRLYFYALTAHFGQWIVTTVGRRTRQWQVRAGLLYGQVKKQYRRRKLVRVTQIMRCGTAAALKAARIGLGLSGQLNTAFVERVKEDTAAERRGPGPPELGDSALRAATAAAARVVANLLSLCATT